MKLQEKTKISSIGLFTGFLVACSAIPFKVPSPSAVNRISVDTSSIPVGDSKDSDPAMRERHATLVVYWPQRTVQVIPMDTESVLFQAFNLDGTLIASASVSRPSGVATSSVTLPSEPDSYLPVGPLILLAQARDGLGKVLAQASESVEVISNQAVSVTLQLIAVETPTPAPTPTPTSTPTSVPTPTPTPIPTSTPLPIMQAVRSAESPVGTVLWGVLGKALLTFGITVPSADEDVTLTSATIRLTVNDREPQKYISNIRLVDGSVVVSQRPGIESATTATSSLTTDAKDVYLPLNGVTVVRNTKKTMTVQGDITSPSDMVLIAPMDRVMISLIDFVGVGNVSGALYRHALSAPVNGSPLAVNGLIVARDLSFSGGTVTPQTNALLAKYSFTLSNFEDALLQTVTIALNTSNGGTIQNVKLADPATGQSLSTTVTMTGGSSQKITLASPLPMARSLTVTLEVRGDTMGLKQSNLNAAVISLTGFEAVTTRSNIQLRLLDPPVTAPTLVFF